MSQIQEWYYAHDADITFGEVHVSKVPKIILTVVLASIVTAGIAAYLSKDYIYDYVTNPHLELVKEVTHEDGNYTDVEIKSKVDLKEFADVADWNNLDYEYEIDDNQLNLNALGSYVVTYKSKNRAHNSETELVINVKDTTNPTITLKNVDLDETGRYVKNLIRGKETESFNAEDYIDKIEDNYSSRDKIVVDYTKNINFDFDSATVIYTATDENGNTGTASLSLIIKEDTTGLNKDLEEAQKELDEIKRKEELEKAKAKEKANAYVKEIKKSIKELDERYVDNSKKKNVESKIKELESAIKSENYDEMKSLQDEVRDFYNILVNDVAKKEAEENAKKTTTANGGGNQSGGNNNGGGGQTTQAPVTNPPQTTTTTTEKQEPYIKAYPVTISINEGPDAVAMACSNNVEYRNGNGVAQPSGIPGYDFQLEVGTYTVTWTTTDGLSCTQKVTITE